MLRSALTMLFPVVAIFVFGTMPGTTSRDGIILPCPTAVAADHRPQPSVKFDFKTRATLPQTDLSKDEWDRSRWGPPAKTYPAFTVPKGVGDPLSFVQMRVVAVAEQYVGLPYMHKHVPATGGLDCSNFSAWVYNYGFGIRFRSGIGKQAETAGRRLGADEPLMPGDLLFIRDPSNTWVSHVAIYVGDDKLIDATGGKKIAVRNFAGWYKKRFSHARRILKSVTKDGTLELEVDDREKLPSDR